MGNLAVAKPTLLSERRTTFPRLPIWLVHHVPVMMTLPPWCSPMIVDSWMIVPAGPHRGMLPRAIDDFYAVKCQSCLNAYVIKYLW